MRTGNRLGSAVIAVILLAEPAFVCLAGQFKYGLGRGDAIKAQWTVPPMVRIGRSSIAIDVKDATTPQVPPPPQNAEVPPPDPAAPIAHLQAALDQAFSPTFTVVQTNGEALLRVAIVQYTPAEAGIQTLQQKMRKPAFNADGSPATDPQTGQPATTEHVIAVEQWTARGQIAVRAEVVDSSGALIDGFPAQTSVSASHIVSVNGQDRLDRTQLPSHAQVRSKLIADLVGQFQARYCPPLETIEIPLAVDEELRPGNKLARDGDFEAAAAAWTAAQLSKPDRESDRTHNLGAVYEARAYHLLSRQIRLDSVKLYLDRAAKHYADAVQLDPKEKYFTRASERIRKAYRLVADLMDKEAIRRDTLAANRTPSPWPPGGAQGVPAAVIQPVAPSTPGQMVTAIPTQQEYSPVVATAAVSETPAGPLNERRPESPSEQAFRQLVRLRVRSGTGAEESPALLESIAAAYGLTEVQAKRTVHQEIGEWKVLQPKIAAYRDSFAAFNRDGTLTPAERDALNTLAKYLGLSEASVSEVETGAAHSTNAPVR